MSPTGTPINVPVNYYPEDDPAKQPQNRWRSHAHLLYGNWINQICTRPRPMTWIRSARSGPPNDATGRSDESSRRGMLLTTVAAARDATPRAGGNASSVGDHHRLRRVHRPARGPARSRDRGALPADRPNGPGRWPQRPCHRARHRPRSGADPRRSGNARDFTLPSSTGSTTATASSSSTGPRLDRPRSGLKGAFNTQRRKPRRTGRVLRGGRGPARGHRRPHRRGPLLWRRRRHGLGARPSPMPRIRHRSPA